MKKKSVSEAEKSSLRGRRKSRMRKYYSLYLMFIPVAVWFIIFCYIPMGGIVIAFEDFKPTRGILGSRWVGLKNFRRLLMSSAFRDVLKNNVIIGTMNLLLVFPAPILLAISINEVRNSKGKRLVQSISYLPHFVSWAIVGCLFYMIFDPTYGPINALIRACGGKAVNFFGSSKWYRWMVVLSSIWKSMGWGSIVYLAAITGIDSQLYEAAELDGASRLQCIFHITLPGIMNVIVVMFILRVGTILSLGFEQTFILLNDAVLSVGETIEYYVYRVGLSSVNNFSLGSAVGLFQSVFGLIMVLTSNYFANKISEDGGIW